MFFDPQGRLRSLSAAWTNIDPLDARTQAAAGRAYLRADILDSQVLAYAGRSISASTAVGSASKHNAEQKQLIEDAFATKLASGEMVIAH